MERLTINGIEKLMGMRIGLRTFPNLRIYEVKDVGRNPAMYVLELEGDIKINIHRKLVMYQRDVTQLWVELELAPTSMVHKPIGYGVLEFEKMLSMDRFIEGLKGIEWKP